MRRFLAPVVCGCSLSLIAVSASAQQSLAGCTSLSFSRERIGDNHIKLMGAVELECGDMKVFADEGEIFTGQDRAVASGNVLFTQGGNRIAADRADFNTKTRLGTFFNATGIATPKPQRQRPTVGIAVPTMAGQETDVYFYGQTVEKIGPKKYKITNGGFTTCVQPTPRWELSSDTVILNIDHYTFLRQSILKVKGVPLLYLPVMYYPTKKEERATGFLIPTYGSSTVRGQTFHNAFFWAVDRSQDATFLYDWFSKTGQGLGSEYRYNMGNGSDGNIRTYLLDQHATTYALADGSASTLPDSRSYELRGSMNHLLPGGFRARGRVDYFSSLVSMQTFNTNINDASRTQRSYGGNLTGVLDDYSINGTYEQSEYFYDAVNSAITGSRPRLAISRSERPLLGSQLYFSMGGEYVGLVRDNKSASTAIDQSLTRLDFTPQIRFPFKRWQWFTVNSTLGWRDTFYTRSLDPKTIDPATNQVAIVDESLNRRFFTAQAQIVGPVFNRIWDTPDSGYAEKFKHSIEPFLNVQRTSSIDNTDHIVQLEGTDSIVGGATQYTYGLTNRFYAKRKEGGRAAQSREIINVELTQTYYTDQNAAQVDRQYATSFTGAPPSHFSPIALSVRATPTVDFNATTRAEFDSQYHSLRTISANGTYAWTGRLQTTVGWSKRAFIKDLAGFNDPNYLDHYINASGNVHTKDNRVGGVYSFNYDVLHSAMLQQRLSGFYNSQCCGIAFEYQTFSFAGIGSYAVPADHRFFLSFTLAGLGNFSPFNGALGGVPR